MILKKILKKNGLWPHFWKICPLCPTVLDIGVARQLNVRGDKIETFSASLGILPSFAQY